MPRPTELTHAGCLYMCPTHMKSYMRLFLLTMMPQKRMNGRVRLLSILLTPFLCTLLALMMVDPGDCSSRSPLQYGVTSGPDPVATFYQPVDAKILFISDVY